jgi:hypothetical protein
MVYDETLRRRTLDILLAHVKSVEDLEMIDCAIEDYQNCFGYNLDEYKKKVEDLRNGCPKTEKKEGQPVPKSEKEIFLSAVSKYSTR